MIHETNFKLTRLFPFFAAKCSYNKEFKHHTHTYTKTITAFNVATGFKCDFVDTGSPTVMLFVRHGTNEKKTIIDYARYSTECIVHIAHLITRTHIVNTFPVKSRNEIQFPELHLYYYDFVFTDETRRRFPTHNTLRQPSQHLLTDTYRSAVHYIRPPIAGRAVCQSPTTWQH